MIFWTILNWNFSYIISLGAILTLHTPNAGQNMLFNVFHAKKLKKGKKWIKCDSKHRPNALYFQQKETFSE